MFFGVAHSFIALACMVSIPNWSGNASLCCVRGKRNNGNHSETGEIDGGYAPDPIAPFVYFCAFVNDGFGAN